MASDYRDCIEMGLIPPSGSEYWIAPFAQEAFNKYVNPNKELSDYLCSITDLQFIEK